MLVHSCICIQMHLTVRALLKLTEHNGLNPPWCYTRIGASFSIK